MIRNVIIVNLLLFVVVVSLLGFRGGKSRKEPMEVFPDMDRQAKYLPQGENPFFSNGMNDRLPPLNSVERGNELKLKSVFSRDYSGERLTDSALLYGRDASGDWAKGFPIPVNRDQMRLGQEKFNLFCAVCHGPAGDGAGIVRNYGMVAANLVQDLYRDQAEGELFNTASWGKGLMMGYADRMSPEERWAVILYVRALQRASSATLDEIPPSKRKELGL